MDKNRLTPADYQRAIDVQDACNLSGVVHAFSKVMTKIWEEARATGNVSADWVNRHPIAVLYSSKIDELTGYCNVALWGKAKAICEERANNADCQRSV